MKTTTRRAVALAGALAITLGGAACSTSPGDTPAGTTQATAANPESGEAPTASELLDKVKAKAKEATSGAVKGEVEQDGKELAIDFKGTNDGKKTDMTASLEGQGKVRIIAVDGAVYVQADKEFWEKQGAPAKVQKAGDKFVKAPAGSEGLAQQLTLSALLDQALSAITPGELSEQVGQESVRGVDCWVLTDKSGKDRGALYVAKDSYEMVRFTGSPKSPGALDFSEWNEDLGITAPPKSEVIDIS
ncbi:MAG: hypothetical protein L0H25_09850 [Micrococcales bacterium]|nr:hypothetical protein [Micrococcales bacterium]